MISQVSEIVLEGADRELALNPGLNIVAGPIASGKTTFVRYLRFLLGGSLGQPPKEARDQCYGCLRYGESERQIIFDR